MSALGQKQTRHRLSWCLLHRDSGRQRVLSGSVLRRLRTIQRRRLIPDDLSQSGQPIVGSRSASATCCDLTGVSTPCGFAPSEDILDKPEHDLRADRRPGSRARRWCSSAW